MKRNDQPQMQARTIRRRTGAPWGWVACVPGYSHPNTAPPGSVSRPAGWVRRPSRRLGSRWREEEMSVADTAGVRPAVRLMVIAGAQLGGVVLPATIGWLIDASSPAVIPSALLAVALACLATALLLRGSAANPRRPGRPPAAWQSWPVRPSRGRGSGRTGHLLPRRRVGTVQGVQYRWMARSAAWRSCSHGQQRAQEAGTTVSQSGQRRSPRAARHAAHVQEWWVRAIAPPSAQARWHRVGRGGAVAPSLHGDPLVALLVVPASSHLFSLPSIGAALARRPGTAGERWGNVANY